MPDHFHLLITPAKEVTLERAMQLIKGGFSHAAGEERGHGKSIWSADSPIIESARPKTLSTIESTFTPIQ
jgi:hypothetical protein